MEWLWEASSPTAFIIITLLLGGGAAWMTGRAIAIGWINPRILLFYTALLACAARFLHFALGDGSLLSAWYWMVDFLILAAIAGVSFRLTRASQMVTQYFWMYERAGPFHWRAIRNSAAKEADA